MLYGTFNRIILSDLCGCSWPPCSNKQTTFQQSSEESTELILGFDKKKFY